MSSPKGMQLLTTVGVGALFGEMSLLSDQPPGATVVARETCEAFFMSREVFRQVKGVADPDRFYDRMLALFHRDVHALHEELGDDAERATFLRLELSRRRGWVVPRQESNRLPYWAQRHNWLYYQVGEEERRFEVRTMNSWDGQWFVTHLSEFRHR